MGEGAGKDRKRIFVVLDLLRRAMGWNLPTYWLAVFPGSVMRFRMAPLDFLCWVLLCALLIAKSATAHGSDRLQSTQWDGYLQRSAGRWMPEYDWRWLKAQCYQESAFDPRAVSPAGARGLCQFMPGTWSDASRAIGVRNVYSPSENSWAAGWYMRRQLNIWTSRRTSCQRLELAQAGYNAGAGHIITAQRLCGGANDWSTISRCLPAVTGHHSAETINYVRQIRVWFGRLECSKD